MGEANRSVIFVGGLAPSCLSALVSRQPSRPLHAALPCAGHPGKQHQGPGLDGKQVGPGSTFFIASTSSASHGSTMHDAAVVDQARMQACKPWATSPLLPDESVHAHAAPRGPCSTWPLQRTTTLLTSLPSEEAKGVLWGLGSCPGTLLSPLSLCSSVFLQLNNLQLHTANIVFCILIRAWLPSAALQGHLPVYLCQHVWHSHGGQHLRRDWPGRRGR